MYLPRLELLPTFIREIVVKRKLQREPEPSLVMEEMEEVKSYAEGGHDKRMAAAYFFINSHATQALYGCKNVIDLGCGPATLLCQIASVNPTISFVGVDLSPTMIAEGHKNIKKYGVKNVTLVQGDISRLSDFADKSFDGVMTSFAIHHLPTHGHLKACFKEMRRVLTPQGSIFIFDFTRLKSLQSVVNVAYLNAQDDPYILSLDRERSMRAAFTWEELMALANETFPQQLEFFSTFKVPVFAMIRTAPKAELPIHFSAFFQAERERLPKKYHSDLDDMRFFFRLDGLINDLFGPIVPGVEQLAKLRMLDFVNSPVLNGTYTSYYSRLFRVFKIIAKTAISYGWYRFMTKIDPKNPKLEDSFHLKMATYIENELSALKGPLMKFGQVMSYLPEHLPTVIRETLSALQMRSKPYSGEYIRTIVEKELRQPINKVFKEWYDTPVAAASISQIHLARLYNDKLVAVKVRYPKILEAIKTDFSILRLFTPWIKNYWGIENAKEVLAELEQLIVSECDFLKAGAYQEEFRIIFEDDEEIVIPQVYTDYSTSEVLVMDYIQGQTYDEFKRNSTQEERNKACEIMWRMAAVSINRYGLYNADPHPGNYVFLKGKLAFLDFGFTRRFSVKFMDLWKQQSIAGCMGDYEGFKHVNQQLGYSVPGKDFDFRIMFDIYTKKVYPAWAHDRVFRFTKPFVTEQQNALVHMYQSSNCSLRMPVEFVSILRLLWGQHVILADLEADVNWHQFVYPLFFEPSEPALFNPQQRRQVLV